MLGANQIMWPITMESMMRVTVNRRSIYLRAASVRRFQNLPACHSHLVSTTQEENGVGSKGFMVGLSVSMARSAWDYRSLVSTAFLVSLEKPGTGFTHQHVENSGI